MRDVSRQVRGTDHLAAMSREIEQAEKRRAVLFRTAAVMAVATALLAGSVAMAISRPEEPQFVADKTTGTVPIPPEAVVTTQGASAPVAEEEPVVPDAGAPTVAPLPGAETLPEKEEAPQPRSTTSGVQVVSVNIGETGYEPSVLRVKAGAPIHLTIGRGEGCAAGFLIPDLGISADNSSGPTTVSLSSLEPGSYRFSCGMDMVSGTIVAD